MTLPFETFQFGNSFLQVEPKYHVKVSTFFYLAFYRLEKTFRFYIISAKRDVLQKLNYMHKKLQLILSIFKTLQINLFIYRHIETSLSHLLSKTIGIAPAIKIKTFSQMHK